MVQTVHGDGSYTDVISGLFWVLRNAQRPAVASMSLSGPTSLGINNAIQELAREVPRVEIQEIIRQVRLNQTTIIKEREYEKGSGGALLPLLKSGGTPRGGDLLRCPT